MIWLNVSRLFIPHIYTQNSLRFNLPFSPIALLLLYIYLPITLHVIPCQIHKGQKWYHLPSIFRWHLPNSNIVVSSNSNLYELATTKEGCLHFLLSDKGNYNFDIKVRHCGFMDFVNNVIDCGCLGYVFYFKIKEKEKDIFYINFYSIIFLQSFHLFIFLITSIGLLYWICMCNL